MSLATPALVLSLLAPTGAAPAAPLDLALDVRNDTELARVQEPLASGIPLPQGAAYDPASLRVYGPDRKPVPCQAHQLGLCWPDGSLRWALVQFQGTVPPRAAATYRLRVEPGRRPVPPRRPVTVKATPGAVTVTTGPLRLTVSRRRFSLLSGLEVRDPRAPGDHYGPVVERSHLRLMADREHMSLAEFQTTGRDPKELRTFGVADTGEIRWGKIQAGIDYSRHLTGPVKITVEEAGPLRAGLRVESAREKREGEVGFVVRLYAFAGKPYLRVEYTLESYEHFVDVPAEGYHQAIVNSKHLRQFSLHLGLREAARTVEYGLPTGLVTAEGTAASSLLQSTPQTCAMTAAGRPPVSEGRAPGWMTVRAGRHPLGVAVRWFWEMAPRGLRYDPRTHEMVLELRPAAASGSGYPLAAGRVKTYEFVVGVDTPGPQLSALVRSELRAYPDPAYVAACGATHRFVPLEDPRFSKYAEYVANTRRQDGAVRLYGDVDFGDQIGWNDGERWNGYHGTTHEWFMFYLASGEPELFRIAEQQTWHSLDVDTQHWGYQPGCREAEYARKYDHVCPAAYQGGIKVWCFGEADYYLLTGRRRVLESLGRTARFLLACGGMGNHSYVPERATSLPFLHLAYLYEVLGDEGALADAWPGAMKRGAGRFRTDSIGPAFSAACLATFREVSDYFNGVYDRGEHVHSSFLASYPAEALHRYYRLTGDPGGRSGVLKAARYLYRELALPTGIIKYAGGPPWDVNSPWMPWWDGVEAPAALAYDLTGDRQYLEWGKAPVDWLLNYRRQAYSSGPWSWQGAMGFGGTLPIYLWALSQAGMTQDDVARLRTDLDYDAALRVCQARCEEFREVSMRNTGESGIFCRLAAEVGRVMVNQGCLDDAIAWLEPWSKAPYGVYAQWVLDRAKALKHAGTRP